MKPSLKLWLAVVGVALGWMNFTFTAQAQNQIVGNLTVQTKILDANGTAAAPSYTFTNSPTTGLFRSAADAIGVSTAGVERWTFNASGSMNPLVNNTYDIGNGTVNPRDVYAARSFIGPLLANAGALTIQSTTAANVTLGYNSTAVIQLDSTSNATVLGVKTLKFGATSAITMGALADTTAGIFRITGSLTGNVQVVTADSDMVFGSTSIGRGAIFGLDAAAFGAGGKLYRIISGGSNTGPGSAWASQFLLRDDANSINFLIYDGGSANGATTIIARGTGGVALKGTGTNDAAAAGSIGELLSAQLAAASTTSLTSTTGKTITSVSLTAGDWEVSGTVHFIPANTTVVASLVASISATDNTQASVDSVGGYASIGAVYTSGGATMSATPIATRISLAATTTYYLVATATFSVSTCTAYGTLRARRVR